MSELKTLTLLSLENVDFLQFYRFEIFNVVQLKYSLKMNCITILDTNGLLFFQSSCMVSLKIRAMATSRSSILTLSTNLFAVKFVKVSYRNCDTINI